MKKYLRVMTKLSLVIAVAFFLMSFLDNFSHADGWRIAGSVLVLTSVIAAKGSIDS